MIRRTVSALVALTLATGLTACSGDKKDPEPQTTDSTTSAEPTPTEAAWEDAYTKKQLDGYKAAFQRWESYLQRSESIWAKGEATLQAEDLFKEYFPDPAWRNVLGQLKSYEQVDVKTQGQARVYWSRAKEIGKNGLSVTIEQCVDYSAGKTTQRGQVVEVADWAKEPRLRVIDLSKPEGYGWLIYGLQDASATKRPRRCTP